MSSVDVKANLGSLEIGIFIFIFLFGVGTLQAWIYYQRFPDDARWLKVMVATLWLLNLGQCLCDTYAVFNLTVTDYGQIDKLTQLPQSVNATFIITGFIAFIAQSFYAYRIRELTGKLYIPVFCWVASLAMLVMALYGAVQAFELITEADYEKHAKPIPWILAASVDVVIAASLCWYFIAQRNTALARTVRLLDKLIRWTIQTGLFTSVVAVTVIITYETMQSNLIWLAISTPLAGLYANSLFALLNARVILRTSTRLGGGGAIINISASGERDTQHDVPKFASLSQVRREEGLDTFDVELGHHKSDAPYASTSE